MSPLKTIGYCLREYPLLTMVGAYGLLYTAGDFIATVVYNEPDYVFGDATALILDTAEACPTTMAQEASVRSGTTRTARRRMSALRRS